MGKSGRKNRAASGLTPADPGHAPGKQHLDRSAERRPTGDGSYGRGIVGRVVRKTRSLRGRG